MLSRSSSVIQFWFKAGLARFMRPAILSGSSHSRLKLLMITRVRWRAYRREPLDRCLHVPQIVNQVGEDDVVEPGFQTELIDVAPHETELRMLSRGPLEHLRRKIDADAERRLERGQQIASAASEFQHPASRRHEVTVNFRQAPIVAGAGSLAIVAIPEPDALCAIALSSRFFAAARTRRRAIVFNRWLLPCCLHFTRAYPLSPRAAAPLLRGRRVRFHSPKLSAYRVPVFTVRDRSRLPCHQQGRNAIHSGRLNGTRLSDRGAHRPHYT